MMDTMSRDTIRDIRRRKFQNPDISTAKLADIFCITQSEVREILGIRERDYSRLTAMAAKGRAARTERVKEQLKAVGAYWADHPDMDAKSVSLHFGKGKGYVGYHVKLGNLIPPDGYDPAKRMVAGHANKQTESAKKRWAVINTYWAANPNDSVADIAYRFDVPQKTVRNAISRGYCKRPSVAIKQTTMTIENPILDLLRTLANRPRGWEGTTEEIAKEGRQMGIDASVNTIGRTLPGLTLTLADEGIKLRKKRTSQATYYYIRKVDKCPDAINAINTTDATNVKPTPITEAPEPPKAHVIKCTHCGAVLAQGAKYCHNCGTKYEDPRTQALRALEKLAQNISTFYPVTARDNAIAAITMITDYIKSTCEEV